MSDKAEYVDVVGCIGGNCVYVKEGVPLEVADKAMLHVKSAMLHGNALDIQWPDGTGIVAPPSAAFWTRDARDALENATQEDWRQLRVRGTDPVATKGE